MVVKLYVLNVFRDETFVRGSESAAVLDFDDAPELQRRLNGHLEGHLRRSGVRRPDWHEYALDVFTADRDGKATGAARIFRWYLPYAEEGS